MNSEALAAGFVARYGDMNAIGKRGDKTVMRLLVGFRDSPLLRYFKAVVKRLSRRYSAMHFDDELFHIIASSTTDDPSDAVLPWLSLSSSGQR